MKLIKIKLAIDPTNEAVTNALFNLVEAMRVGEKVSAKVDKFEQVKAEEVKQPKTVKETPKPAEQNQEVKETPSEGAITLQQVRQALADKTQEHRDAIKAKLTELGAKSVTVLDKQHWATMHAFLEAL